MSVESGGGLSKMTEEETLEYFKKRKTETTIEPSA